MLNLPESGLARGFFGGGAAIGFRSRLGSEAGWVGGGVEVAWLLVGLVVVVVVVRSVVVLVVEEADVVGAAEGGGREGFVGVLELSGEG